MAGPCHPEHRAGEAAADEGADGPEGVAAHNALAGLPAPAPGRGHPDPAWPRGARDPVLRPGGRGRIPVSDRHIWAPEKRLYDSPGSATACEIEFIKGLGTHLDRDLAPVRTIRPIDRLWLLRGYLRSMERRADWGHIDQGKVRIRFWKRLRRNRTSWPSGL